MPKREDIQSVMVIGSGPIVIGQAAEFDYSGTQACRVLKEEGVRVILVNSNPATIMTDPEMADATYIEPIDCAILERIVAKERPDALLPTLGGQTALNAAEELGRTGVLDKYGVELIGASLDAIDRGEDRQLFKQVVEAAGAESARSRIAHSLEEADAVAAELGYPLVVRPSFTMGGLGSGIAHDEGELHRIAGAGIHYSPTDEVLLEEGIEGWKEYELELMRDRLDNVVVVCPIENVDPVGVHTGDSVTVAPVFTLTDREYQKLRDIGIAIIRGVGVDTGGCNIQFAVNPETGRVIVIEMNPRVSRSSALASKATGFPIAKIATKLALGYTLDEIVNDITRSTPASFEPAIDYVVTKVPRFAFEKFPGADDTLTTSMKSVGEAMALGGSFQESLGKAMRSIDKRGLGFSWDGARPDHREVDELLEAMRRPTEGRYLQIQRAFWGGAGVDEVFLATGIDRWFLEQINAINHLAMEVREADFLDDDLLRRAKRAGLSDLQIAHLRGMGDRGETVIRELRWNYQIRPVYKTVDTCAAEFDAVTPYYYSTYAEESELKPRRREAVIILGSGPNRIGQGVEFDYTCVHAVQELGRDYDTIMVNCNPETVSTDYDMSDRLYFEPLTFEDVLEIYRAELRMGPVKGVIVQLGGQTPLSLAARLKQAGVPILGTSPESIDLAENRELFGQVLKREGLNAPRYGTAMSLDEARDAAHNIGYPVLVRPSYVLGGRGMEIVYDDGQLGGYVERALRQARADTVVSGRLPSPLLIDKFLQDAIEIDVDALYDGNELYIGGIMEHVEEAGVHSGDASCTLPPSTLSDDQIDRLRQATRAIADGCGVRGLINVQFAFMANTLYVIEANPRASRTVPFASKATGTALAKAAARIMVGESVADQRARGLLLPDSDGGASRPGQPVAVKEAVLPFKRFRTPVGQSVDVLLGPEMRSTGEVMGFDRDFPHAFAKGQLAAYAGGLPTSGRAFLSVNDADKRQLPMIASRLHELGFTICATQGTASVLKRYGIDVDLVGKISDGDGREGADRTAGRPGRNAVELIEDGSIDMVLNSPSSRDSRSDGYLIRAAAVAADLPQFTTVTQFAAVLMAIEAVKSGDYQVVSIQERARRLFAYEHAEG
ncbi:carbamoyl-phosphate synthase large subunit [Bifidobacterium xylocopae]|uniref:Carbamoyl phosphate synthase large chain n=1 Tax=Bifidobacterium xylocopae TaxID=2493119 RepID=A0A366KDW6_9BIFI|nr:carbamoyl-phosphate synthase large subunit [Bifidobacterium xylocopae]RBP99925.1 carbamoyl phosphate synthase large subunit [Bifidobacterium xylocopae]